MRPGRTRLPYAASELVVDVKQHVHVKREGFRFVGDDQQESTVRRDVVAGDAHPRVFGKGLPEQLPFRPAAMPRERSNGISKIPSPEYTGGPPRLLRKKIFSPSRLHTGWPAASTN